MPHCTLEYSANLPDREVNCAELFKELHTMLAGTGAISLSSLKSRWYCRDNFYVGDGSNTNGYVYLQIAMLDGRPLEVRTQISQSSQHILQKYLPKSALRTEISITVEIREIVRVTHTSASDTRSNQ